MEAGVLFRVELGGLEIGETEGGGGDRMMSSSTKFVLASVSSAELSLVDW